MSCALFEFIRAFQVADLLNDCVCCDVENRIGNDGIRDIAEALKVNSTLVDINLIGGNIAVCVFHSPLTHSRADNVINDVGVSYIIDAFKENVTLTSVWLSGGDGESFSKIYFYY